MHSLQLRTTCTPKLGMLHRLERFLLPIARSTKHDVPSSVTLLKFLRQNDLQELVGWEVCLLRSRTRIGFVTEVRLAGGETLAKDDKADAPGNAISSSSSSSSSCRGAVSKVVRRKEGFRNVDRGAAAVWENKQAGDLEQDIHTDAQLELPIGVLLRVQQHADLHPFQFKGMERHLLPLVPQIVVKLDPSTRVIYAQPPAGFLELGHRSLYLTFLQQALRSYVQPLLAPPTQEGKGKSGSKTRGNSRSSHSSDVGQGRAMGINRGNGLNRHAGLHPQSARLSDRLSSSEEEPAEEVVVPPLRRQEDVVMPSRDQLEALGQQELVRLIIKAGGFRQVAADLGYHTPNLKRPRGFLQDIEALDAEISHFIAQQWVTMDDGRNPYYYNQVTGRISRAPPTSCEDQGQRQRVLPTEGQFRAAARGDIHYAIVTHHGGYKRVAKTLRRRPVKQSDTAAWLSQPELLKAELSGLAKELGLDADRLPTEQQLLVAGRSDVLHAVRLAGGFPAVAQRLRMRSFRTSSRGKLKDLDAAACSLLSFSLQQLLTQRTPTLVQQQQQQQQQQVQQAQSQQMQQERVQQMQIQEQQQAQALEGTDDLHAQQQDRLELGLLAQFCEQSGGDPDLPPSQLLSKMRAKLDPLRLPFPTVQNLVHARRYDIVYLLRQHDRHKLAQRCGYTLDGVSYATNSSTARFSHGMPESLTSSSRSKASGAAVRGMLLSLMHGCGLPNKKRTTQTGRGKLGGDRAITDGSAVQGDTARTNLGALSTQTDVVTARTDRTISEAAASVGRQEWSPNAVHQVLLAAGVNATLATVMAQLRKLVAGGQIQRRGRGVYVACDSDKY